MKRSFMKTCILTAGAAVLTVNAFAQARPPVDLSQKGSGTVHFNGHNYAISSVHVTLTQGGSASVVARISGPDVTLNGTWRAEGTTARLMLDTMSFANEKNDRISATGRMVFDKDGDPRTITITGKNVEDKNNVTMNFKGGDTDHRTGHKLDQDRTARVAAGHYTDTERWSRNGQDFQVLYTLDLAKQSGQAIMKVSPQGDRNEPNDKTDRSAHGTILDYLHTNQTVTQTGHWWQKGDNVYITFTRIEYGSTSRDKSERLTGRIKGTTIFIDEWDKSLYGHDAKLSFEKA